MQDIGDQQFLVLLLMIEAELDQRNDLRKFGFRGLVEQAFNRRIDVRPIGRDRSELGRVSMPRIGRA